MIGAYAFSTLTYHPKFDTCDERKHFQLVVPVWARHYPPLLNAICATSARYLYRSKYHTTAGIVYKGQHFPELTSYTAVEYMLACIPALRELHNMHDKALRDLIVATAVILRQCEEMEDEDDIALLPPAAQNDEGSGRRSRVNFLDIINTVIRSSQIDGEFSRNALLDVAYWISLRQEVYSAFTQRRSPQMLLADEQWHGAAAVNKMVMHAAQVAKWLYDDRSIDGWSKPIPPELKRTEW